MNKKIRNKIKGEFASIFEKVIYDDAKQRKIDISYEPRTFDYQKRSPRGCKCGDCGSARILIPGRYTPDFLINGRVYVEAKGFFKPEKRSNMEDFLKFNAELPDPIDLRFLFAQDNWMTKKKKNKYSDWARKHKVIFYVGKTIPYSWTTGRDGPEDQGPIEPNELGVPGAAVETGNRDDKPSTRRGKGGRNKQKKGSPEPKGGIEDL